MTQQVKVVVIGSVGVGKSSLTTRFVFNEFNENMGTTLGAAYFEKVHDYGQGKSMKFQFWDTAGQEKFRAIAKIYYKDARVAIVVYDVTNRESFEGLKLWMEQLKQKGPENLVIAVVGNKIDLLNEAVSIAQGQEYAKENGAIFKTTSAKQSKGLQQLFNSIASQVQNKQPLKKNQNQSIKNKKDKKNNNECC